MQVKPIRPECVAIYIRWSTDDQGEGTTLEVQREACRHYSLSQGWQYSPALVFVDDGVSGGTLDRPSLSRLRKAVANGDVDCVVVYKLDRLSRNVVDTVNLVLREWEGRCHVKSAREAIDTASPHGRMFFYTLVSFAEWERSVIRDRTMAGRLRRLQEGRNPGFRPPYGFCRGAAAGRLTVVEQEAAVVRRLFALRLSGLGYQSIARQFEAEGISFREGRPFTPQTIMAMLRNPIYAGRLSWGGQQTEGAVPAIIAPDAFDRAQGRRRDPARAPSNRSVTSDHLLTGVLRCRRCDSAMMGRRGRGGAAYYLCTGQRSKGPGFCDAGYIRQDLLDQWLLDRFVRRFAGAALPPPATPTLTPLTLVQRKHLLQALLPGLRVYRRPDTDTVDCELTWIAG